MASTGVVVSETDLGACLGTASRTKKFQIPLSAACDESMTHDSDYNGRVKSTKKEEKKTSPEEGLEPSTLRFHS